MEPLLLTTKEAFRALSVGKTVGYKLIARGDLEAVRLQGNRHATRIPVASVRAYVAKLRDEQVAA